MSATLSAVDLRRRLSVIEREERRLAGSLAQRLGINALHFLGFSVDELEVLHELTGRIAIGRSAGVLAMLRRRYHRGPHRDCASHVASFANPAERARARAECDMASRVTAS